MGKQTFHMHSHSLAGSDVLSKQLIYHFRSFLKILVQFWRYFLLFFAFVIQAFYFSVDQVKGGIEKETKLLPQWFCLRAAVCIAVKSRNCFFPDESLDSVSLFKRYSQVRCFFQCMLELAR